MTDRTSDLDFKLAPTLEESDVRAWVDPEPDLITIQEIGDPEYTVKLTVSDARALRDWLNKVLP